MVSAWNGEVRALFTSAACLTVLDDSPQSTTSVICQRASVVDDELSFTGRLTGMRLRGTSLAQILTALGRTQFPPEGLTIGVVLDANREPLANRVVVAPDASIVYLSADRASVGGSGTSANGIFISTDAPFGTTFSTSGGPIATATSMGGLIEGKVTIAVLQFDEPVVGGGD